MMSFRKSAVIYNFSVEGETEKWYLEWLRDQINSCDSARYKVRINCSIQKDPLKYAKGLSTLDKVCVWHLADYESDESIHRREFEKTIDRMKKAESIGKQIKYYFGYSNFTFELWMILHKTDCRTSFVHRSKYLAPINNAFDEHFENLDEYKHEKNFKRCLSKLSLDDVKNAVERSKQIMFLNKEKGFHEVIYNGVNYYKENPSLMVWEVVENMLDKCKVKGSQ